MTKIALSFDDGRRDNYVMAKEILEPMSIPATFNITIGYIEGNIEEKDMPSLHEPMTLEEMIELDNNKLFEIAGHGYKHNNDVDNLIVGVNELRRVLKKNDTDKIGIVSPHSEFDTNTINECIQKFKENNISYLRVGKRFSNNSFFRRVIRKANRKINIPKIYSWVYNESDVKKEDEFILYTAGIIKDTKLKEVKKLVEDAIKKDKSYILTLHSILKPEEEFYDDLFTWDYNTFYELCKYLKELEKTNKIKICKTIDILN